MLMSQMLINTLHILSQVHLKNKTDAQMCVFFPVRLKLSLIEKRMPR